MKKAIVLLSGGIDSAVCVCIAKDWGNEVFALSFNYGQKHILELNRARILAAELGVKEHMVLELPHIKPTTGNFFPGRNTIFIAYALSYAETIGARQIYLGNNADDFIGFPDCRPDYIEAFKQVVKLATKEGSVDIVTPLVNHSKADVIGLANFYSIDLTKTLSCYEPGIDGTPCGECGACKVRLNGFDDANLKDPVRYKSNSSLTVEDWDIIKD